MSQSHSSSERYRILRSALVPALGKSQAGCLVDVRRFGWGSISCIRQGHLPSFPMTSCISRVGAFRYCWLSNNKALRRTRATPLRALRPAGPPPTTMTSKSVCGTETAPANASSEMNTVLIDIMTDRSGLVSLVDGNTGQFGALYNSRPSKKQINIGPIDQLHRIRKYYLYKAT
jgi:hypothetical protein